MAELPVIASPGVAVIEHWLAGGEMLPTQQTMSSVWTPEKKLAAAVLRDALIVVREACGERAKKAEVKQDLRWIFSDDRSWPYTFVSLCELFGIDPAWVRGVVREWQALPCAERQRFAPRFRNAA